MRRLASADYHGLERASPEAIQRVTLTVHAFGRHRAGSPGAVPDPR